MKISNIRVLFVILSLLGTYFLLQQTSGTKNTPILQSLANFPRSIDGWQMQKSFLSSPEVSSLLRVDDYIHYGYLNKQKHQINLYIAYYESVGTGGGYHSPKNCLPGGGWGISQTKAVLLDSTDEQGRKRKVTEMIIQNKTQYQIVLYWYQNRGRTIHNEYWEKIFLVLDAIFKGRRDGSFIRIMIDVPDGNIQQAEKTVKKFAESVFLEINNYIPGN